MEAHVKANRIFEFFKYSCLALFPILSIYKGVFVFNLGTLLLLIIMIIDILIKKGSIDINAQLFIVLISLAVLNIITGLIHIDVLNISGCLNNSIELLIVAVVCAYFVKSTIVEKDIFYRYIGVVAVISSLFVFVQYYFYTKGIILNGHLPVDDTFQQASISYGRPNSFFNEPAHFVIYVLPVYVISLYKKKYLTSIILLSALIVSTSTTGIIIAIIVTIIFIAKEKGIPYIIKWIFFLIGLIVLLQFIPLIVESDLFKKISFVNLKENIRVFGTLEYFKYFNVRDIIFGIGVNQLTVYMKIFAGYNVYNYASALIFSFFSFGLLGGTIWNLYVIKLYNLSKNKMLYIVFILIYISDQILFNRNLIYLLLILFVFSDSKKEPVQIQK